MADVAAQQKHFLSGRVEHFTESVIREMTRQAMLYGAINLAQGFPDFPAPAEIKQAAQEAVAADINQYAITWGAKNLRQAIARKMQEWQGISVDPEKEVTVCCGSTACATGQSRLMGFLKVTASPDGAWGGRSLPHPLLTQSARFTIF